MKTLKIQIPTMQSTHCQMRVSNALKTVEGVSNISTTPGIASISVDNDVQQTAAINAIEKSGYLVEQIETANPSDENDKTLQFKTNINCGGCVEKVTPFLNEAEGICHWDVDTANQEKILSVHSNGITEQEVIQKVQEAGFKIELLTH